MPAAWIELTCPVPIACNCTKSLRLVSLDRSYSSTKCGLPIFQSCRCHLLALLAQVVTTRSLILSVHPAGYVPVTMSYHELCSKQLL